MNPALANLPLWLDLLLAALIVVGVAFALVGSWGLAKLSDFTKRLHGPTKATTLGVGCVLIASGLWFTFGAGQLSLHELMITLFLFMTAPVSAQLLIKSAMRVGAAPQPPAQPQIAQPQAANPQTAQDRNPKNP